MLLVTRLFDKLKKARGVLKAPPKPPYPELKPHPTRCNIPKHMMPRRDFKVFETEDLPVQETLGAAPVLLRKSVFAGGFGSKKNKLTVTDFSRAKRFLAPVTANAYERLFDLLKHETQSSVSSNVWQILSSLTDTNSTRLLPMPIQEVGFRTQ